MRGTKHVHMNVHVYVTVFALTNHLAHFIIIEISTALYNDFQTDSADLFSFLIEPSIPKLWAFKGIENVWV